MAGKLRLYKTYGLADAENILYINVQFVTSLQVQLDPESGVWTMTINRVGGPPLVSECTSQEEAMAELKEWQIKVETGYLAVPLVGNPDQ